MSCYNVTDYAKLTKSKNIETGISTMSLCIRFKLNLLIYDKASEKKAWTSQFVRNHEKYVLWKTTGL